MWAQGRQRRRPSAARHLDSEASAMEIILARDMGFCWGVRRAITIMEKAAEEKGRIKSLGPIVHNRQAVGKLEEKGVQMISGPEATDGGPAAICAPGLRPP